MSGDGATGFTMDESYIVSMLQEARTAINVLLTEPTPESVNRARTALTKMKEVESTLKQNLALQPEPVNLEQVRVLIFKPSFNDRFYARRPWVIVYDLNEICAREQDLDDKIQRILAGRHECMAVGTFDKEEDTWTIHHGVQ